MEDQNTQRVTTNGTQRQPATTLTDQILWWILTIIDTFALITRVNVHIIESIYRMFVPLEQKSVQGEIVLVTGAGHGIGKQLALAYASAGATVVAWDVNVDNNEETVKNIEQQGYPKAHAYKCDVSNRSDVFEVAKKVRQEVGDVTILINNAGIMPTHTLLDHTKEEIDRIFGINVMAHFWTIQAFLPAMKKNNHGHIVALSSCAGIFGLANLSPYCGSKFAVRGLMEGLCEELRMEKSKVSITTIFPYMTNTGLCKKPKIRFEKLMALLEPEEVAQAIMKAQRTGVIETTVPAYIMTLNNIGRMLPTEGALLLKDFIDSGVESDL